MQKVVGGLEHGMEEKQVNAGKIKKIWVKTPFLRLFRNQLRIFLIYIVNNYLDLAMYFLLLTSY